MERTAEFGEGEFVDAGEPPRSRARRPRRMRGYALAILIVLVLLGALAAIKGTQIAQILGFAEEAQRAGPPPEAVAADTATSREWSDTLAAVGTVASTESVSVRTEVAGVVRRIAFTSGSVVSEGDVLVELDDRIERADLESAIAAAELARVTAERTRELARRGVLARAELDQAEADLRTAVARVEMQRGLVEKKIIRAPFDGRAGIRAVSEGQYVEPGAELTSLASTEGTFVDFTLPQDELARVRAGMTTRFHAPDGSTLEGTIMAMSPVVEESTRAVQVRARVDEGAERLRPGMFVDVSVVLPRRGAVVVVPSTAIVHAPYGDSVFVLERREGETPDGEPLFTARQRFVRTGQHVGDFVAIARGVRAGERVVTAGAFKLRNGSPVFLSEAGVPEAQLAPRPENR